MKHCTPACPQFESWGPIAPGKGRCHDRCDDTHQRPVNYATCVTVTEGAKCHRAEPEPRLFEEGK